MDVAKLLLDLHKQGLEDHLVLHLHKGQVILGNLSYEKGKPSFRGENYLSDFKPEQLKPCWENGTLGMITNAVGHEWESLTFYGLEFCQLPADLSSTRHGAMVAAENEFGDKLIDFVGSIYRGFQLMLDYHFLPVILLKPVKATSGETGLIVTDLRATPMAISLIQTIHDEVRKSIADHLAVGLDDTNLNTAEFENLFGEFMSRE